MAKVEYPPSFHEYNNQQNKLKKLGKKFTILTGRNKRYWPLQILIDFNGCNKPSLNVVKCIEKKCGVLVQRKKYKHHVVSKCKYYKWNGKDILYVFTLDPGNNEWVKETLVTRTKGVNKKDKSLKRKVPLDENQISIFDAFKNNKTKPLKRMKTLNKSSTTTNTNIHIDEPESETRGKSIEEIMDCVEGVFIEYDEKEMDSEVQEYLDYSSAASTFIENESDQTKSYPFKKRYVALKIAKKMNKLFGPPIYKTKERTPKYYPSKSIAKMGETIQTNSN
eukprot:260566_1